MTDRTESERLAEIRDFAESLRERKGQGAYFGWSDVCLLLQEIDRLQQERDAATREGEAWNGVAETHKENWLKVQAALSRTLREAEALREEVGRLKDYITLRPAYDSPLPQAPAQPSADDVERIAQGRAEKE